jgi:DNA-directed RNA polymerase specialized sigma24 family protein
VVEVKGHYTVRAVRWDGGWELHVPGVGVTQSRSLAKAEAQVRDYLETVFDENASEVAVDVVPEVGGLEKRAESAAERTLRAALESRRAAAEIRNVVWALREAGVSVEDTAAILHVSKGRVSQLAKPARLRSSPATKP